MATIERSVEIAAPAELVWGLLEDVRRLPEYSAGTEEVLEAPERLTAVGQTYVQVGRLLGKRVTSRWRVTAIEAGRLLVSEGSPAAGVRFSLTQRLEALDGGRSRLSVDIDYVVPGGVLGRFAARAGVEARAGHEAQGVLDGIRDWAEDAARRDR